MIPSKKNARLAGLCFLLMVVFGLFAEIFFRQKVFGSTDAAVTAGNILSNRLLYRTGIVSDILMSLSYLLTALVLFKLLASVNKEAAAVMVVFAAAGSTLLMFNILFESAPLVILSGNLFPDISEPGRQAMAMLFYTLYEHGYMIGQVFFALWVLPLGVLIYKSEFIPRIFGVLFFIEALFGFVSVIVHFLVPNQSVETVLLCPGTVAEFTFMFWLLIRGIKRLSVPKTQ